ncbi:MAG: tRNA (N(6)-L-threonylcarbamoyladenosine(37)-C(2))-methylthiotransferase MtaB [Ignavibacteriaceae bacterium]|nr:tRNA (N(6)-L-threonylcarbamoyladenosine(37)-C(2))-methylthiotransferase MtaB [Ignavibacteriaceae bacterium]
MKKVALYTLGCKLNFSETSAIGKQFKNNGFDVVDFEHGADVYVVNTCTVTENAEKDCRQIVRRALRNNPQAYVIVTGCYAQLRPDEIKKIEGVDLVLGSAEKFDLFSYTENFEKKDLACIFVSPSGELTNSFGLASSTDADTRTRAYYKIQDGCDYKCSFCTIPLARGKSRSLDPETAVLKFRELVDQGYKEIILTGVNVGDYGINYDTDLYKLLLRFLETEGEYRIRISSIEPNLLTDDILKLTRDNEKMCRHFHIPLQSGSQQILKLMQRRYKADYYRDLILRAKDIMPDLGIGIDVIVGFPGEGEKEFQETHDFLHALPLSYLHVFTYSERPDTKAIEMPGKVDVFERKNRNNILRNLSDKKKFEFYNSRLGSEEEVLFEEENHEGIMRGFSSNYIRVEQPYNSDYINKLVKVKLSETNGRIAKGQLLLPLEQI